MAGLEIARQVLNTPINVATFLVFMISPDNSPTH
jgi:hypothetical protein